MKRLLISRLICVLLLLIIIGGSIQGLGIEPWTWYSDYSDSTSMIYDFPHIQLSYSFQDPIIDSIEIDNTKYSVLKIQNLSTTQDPGKPQLPVKNVNILLPPNTKVKHIMNDADEKELLLNHQILPCGRPMTIGDIPATKIIDQDKKFKNLEKYPEDRVIQIDIQQWRGYSLLMLKIYPIQYYPHQNLIHYSTQIRFSIILEHCEQEHNLWRNLIEDKQKILTKVENPSITSSYESLIPNQKNSANYEKFSYLIITSDRLASSFQPLLDYKKQYITSTMISLSTIDSDFTGGDLQEKIRECIRYYYQNHQTEFVLLGGDVNVIPYRGLWGEAIDHEGLLLQDNAIPSDLYFACLDATWDIDNDGIYGEDKNHSIGEEADFYAEVYVGRAPVETPDEVEIFLNKVISYETEEKPEGVALHQSGINIFNYPDSTVIPERCAKWIPENFTIKKLYQKNESIGKYDWDTLFRRNQYMIIEHTGNGVQDRYFLIWPELIFYNTDCQGLRNQFYPIHTSIACDSGAFEYEDCLAERILLNAFGGASACLFNSRRGFTSSLDAHRYSGEMIEQQFYYIFQEIAEHIGQINQYAKETFASEAMNDPAYRWCFYCLNLLGDPEMPIFETRVSSLSQHIYYVDDDFNSSTPGWNKTHFNTIQEGINKASSWDTVFVYSGQYQEAITIEKKILVTGESKTNTILFSHTAQPVVSLQSSHARISNLNIQNRSFFHSSKGINSKNVSWITIFNCVFTNHSTGIYTNNCSDVIIANNLFESNLISIWNYHSHADSINNKILGILPGGYGVYQIGDYKADKYLWLGSSISRNIISTTKNMCHNFTCGIFTDSVGKIKSNLISNCTLGIWCHHCSPIIQFNRIEDNGHVGIFTSDSESMIMGNIIINNGYFFNATISNIGPGGIIHEFKDRTPSMVDIRFNTIYNNKGFGIFLQNYYQSLVLRFLRYPSVFMNSIYDNSVDAFFINSSCKWRSNYWGNISHMIKYIHGVYIKKNGMERPSINIDPIPLFSPINPSHQTNNITFFIRAGWNQYQTNGDYGFGYYILGSYNMERPLSINIIVYYNSSNGVSVNQTTTYNLDPLLPEITYVDPGINCYYYTNSYICNIEIIVKTDEGLLLAKRSGVQIGRLIIFTS